MRVCFINIQKFGVIPDIFEYCHHLSLAGIDCIYVGLGDRQEEFLHSNGTSVIHLKGTWLLRAGKGQENRPLAKQIIEQVKDFAPDIIHIFHFRGCYLLPRLGRKILPYARWICDVRTAHIRGSMRWLKDRITKFEAQYFDRILTITATINHSLRPSIRKIDVIPLGASYERFNPPEAYNIRKAVRAEYGIPEGAPVVLYAGAVTKSRRLDRMLEAFNIVGRRRDDICFIVVGGTTRDPESKGQVERLMDISERLCLNHRIIFTGRVPFEEVVKYYVASDIGLSYVPLDRKYQHQPPTKLIEYMMCGYLIAVATGTKASLELAKDSMNVIVCDDTPSSVAEGIQRAVHLLKDDKARRDMINRAQQALTPLHYSKIIGERLLPFYQGLLFR